MSIPAIATSGIVSKSNLPERPSRRGSFGRGPSVVGCSSVNDIFAFDGYEIQNAAPSRKGSNYGSLMSDRP